MTDRQLLWGAGAVALVVIALTILFSPAPALQASKVPSTYSSAEGGARAAFLLLQELDYPVLRWEEPPSQLAVHGNAGILVLAEPTQTPTDSDRRSLLRFVTNGGRVLFCGSKIRQFFPAAEIKDRTQAELTLAASVPSRWTRGARQIVLQANTVWGNLNQRQVPLYSNEDGPVVVWWQMGSGQVLWWAAATPLTNAALSRADNLQLLLNAVSPEDGDLDETIYWDEFFHGERSSLWSYVPRAVLSWGVADLVLLAGLILFAYSRRWGPVFRPRRVSRLSPLEFVDTLGGLYRRAGATSVPVAVSYRQLRFTLARRLGLGAGSSDGELSEAASDRLGWVRSDLADVLARAAAGQGGKPPKEEALAVVRAMEQYRQRLRPGRPVWEEKR